MNLDLRNQIRDIVPGRKMAVNQTRGESGRFLGARPDSTLTGDMNAGIREQAFRNRISDDSASSDTNALIRTWANRNRMTTD